MVNAFKALAFASAAFGVAQAAAPVFGKSLTSRSPNTLDKKATLPLGKRSKKAKRQCEYIAWCCACSTMVH